MTHRSPVRPDPPEAMAVPQPCTSRSPVLAWTIMLFVVLASLLWAAAAQAQTETEISEEEAAEVADSSDIDFDFLGTQSPVSIEQLRQMQQHFTELSRDVIEATVSVQVGQNQGTGVIVTRDGYVMTAAHVIGGANRPAIIKLPDSTELKATTLGLNREFDSGLLKIDEAGKYPYLSPGVSADLKAGQWVMAIGHPGGWEEDRGLVFRIGRILNHGDSAISTDCSLVGGDSGGPLVDMDGNVIGIHSRIGLRLTDNVHVPVDVFSEQWDDLTHARDWGRGIGGVNPANEPWIGMSFEDDSLIVESVVKDGPADKAGIQAGDKLMTLDDVRIGSQRRFGFLFNRLDPKDTITIKLKRGEEELELEVKVGSRRDAN